MKKIAFLTYDWNNEVVSQFITGTHRFVEEHEDVSVHLFNGFGRYGLEEADKGSLRIFELPDLKNYDALVIEGNRAWKPELRQKIADHGKALGMPVVSINYPLKGCMEVASDNYGSMAKIVEHVILHHGIKKIAFVTGLLSSPEAQARRRAFYDVCRENHVTDIMEIEGSWKAEAGRNAVKFLYESDRMPQALICSNDDAAYGATRVLRKLGYRIPQDIIVTGFDNMSIAKACEPRLTTVTRDYDGIAYAALDLLDVQLNHGINSGTVYVPGQLVEASSCGCGNEHSEVLDVKKNYMHTYRHLKQFYGMHDAFEIRLSHADSLSDIADIMEELGPGIGCGNIYMVINGSYYDKYRSSEEVTHYGDTMYLMGIADGRKHEKDSHHVYKKFSSGEILPEHYSQKSRIWQICPLRYDETAIGYVVMDGYYEGMEFNFLEILFTLIDSALDNVHKKYLTHTLNDQLSSLYVRDQLTGLYNRFGLEKYGQEAYEKARRNHEDVMITFIDIDNMKNINDKYGHDSGDVAIELTADSIRDAIGDGDGIGIRYGGDEFVVVGGKNVAATLRKNVDYIRENGNLHFPYNVSIGEKIVKPEEDLDVHKAIDLADNNMYLYKKSKKSAHKQSVA